MEQKKAAALNSFKEARSNYMNNPTPENWKAFCEAKRICRLLGVII